MTTPDRDDKPAAWRMVPVEPTTEMVRAFNAARPASAVQEEDGGWSAPLPDWFRAKYDAMLRASPAPDDGGLGSSADADTHRGSADRWADLERLAKAAAKRAPGLWGSDIEKSDGSYGSGDDDRSGFMVPYMETEHGKRLFDAQYCDVAEVHEDYDSDEHGSHIYAWDEASREIFAFLAAVQPAAVLALIAAARGARAGYAGAEGDEVKPNLTNRTAPATEGETDVR